MDDEVDRGAGYISLENIPLAPYTTIVDGKQQVTIPVFHGCTRKYDDGIILSKFRDDTDFGRGFYTTVLEKQAKYWAHKKRLIKQLAIGYVYHYEFTFILQTYDKLGSSNCQLITSDDGVKGFQFMNENDAWIQTILNHRLRDSKKPVPSRYDFYIGPVLDKNTKERKKTLNELKKKEITMKEAIEILKFHHTFTNQITFHTDRVIKNHLIQKALYKLPKNIKDNCIQIE
jgi:hypothetical protein